MKINVRLHFACAVLLVLTACTGDLEHTAPFDPETSRDKQAGASVTGKFTLEGEKDHAGIEVRFEGPTIQDISTKADGTFALNGLIPGRYAITVSERGWEEVTREVVFDIGEVAALREERLPLRSAAVAGSLVSSDGEDYDYSGFKLTAVRTGSPRGSASAPAIHPLAENDPLYDYVLERESLKVLDNGSFQAELPAGSYDLYGEPPAYSNPYYKPFETKTSYYYYYAPALATETESELTPVASFEINGEEGLVEIDPIEVKWLSGDLELRGTLADGTTESNLYTATRTVKLRITAANASKMIVGEEDALGGCLVSAPVDFSVAPVFELSEGDGVKTVCVLLANEDLSQTVALRKSIILDTTPPLLSVVRVNGGERFSTVSTVPLELVAYDNVSGLDKIARSRNGTDIGTIDYVPAFNDTLVSDGDYDYTLQVVDKAGNYSSAVTQSLTLDRLAPSGLSIVINGGELRTSERLFDLTLDPSDASEIQISLDAAFGGIAWQPVTTATQMFVSRSDGTVTVYLRGRDGAGNVSEVVSDSVTLDTTPPDAVAIALTDIDGDGFPLTHAVAEVSWSESADPNASAYELQRYVVGLSNSFEAVTQTAAGVASFADDITESAGRVHQYRVRVIDSLGQASQWSNVLAVNTMAADGQVCWVVNQADASDIDYVLVPPTGAISSQATSSFLDMASGDAKVTETYPDNSLSFTETRRALDVAQAGFSVVSKNLDSTYRQQGSVDAPMGWHWDSAQFTTGYVGSVRVRVDSEGTVHVFYVEAGALYYTKRVNDTWSERTQLDAATGSIEVRVELDAEGALHVVYANVSGNKLLYLTNESGTWSAPAELATGSIAGRSNLRVGPQGELHVAYIDGSTLYYRKTTGGTWQAPQAVTNAGSVKDRAFGFDIDGQGAAHVSYQNGSKYFSYVNNVGGTWNPSELPEGMLPWEYGGEMSSLRVADDGTVYVVEYNGDPYGASSKNFWTLSGGTWSSTVMGNGWDTLGLEVPMVLDRKGTLHFIDRKDGNNATYRFRDAGGSFSSLQTINPSQTIGQFFDVFADDDGAAHLVYATNNVIRYVTNKGSQTSVSETLQFTNAHPAPFVVDSAGAAHAVYGDWQALYYHNNTAGTWTSRIEIQGSAENVQVPSITVDSADRLHVVYSSYGLQALRYTYRDGATWSAAVSLDSSIGSVSEPPAIATDGDDNLHVAYLDAVSGDLRYVSGTPGNWSAPVTIDATGDTGHFVALALDRSGLPHVAYIDKTSGYVKYMRNTGSGWTTAVNVAQAYYQYARTPVGLGVDSAGTVHIVFLGLNDSGLKYTHNRSGSFASPSVLDGIRNSAAGASVRVDSHDQVHVGYVGDKAWKYTWHTGRRWMPPTVLKSDLSDFYGDVGGYPSLALDRDERVHLMVFDGSSGAPRYKAMGNEVGCGAFDDLIAVSPF